MRAYSSALIVLLLATSSAAAADITLSVDAREAPRKILHASETIPVAPGPLSLVYPKWIPGEHGPTGPIIDMAGLRLSVGGKKLAWKRDLGEMYRFDTQIPEGATNLLVEFDFLVPGQQEGFSSGSSTTAQLGVISWNQMLLYPLGADPAKLMILPDVRVPEGWQLASALVRTKRRAAGIAFEPVSLEQLIDSPVLTGAYFRSHDLAPGQTPAHRLNIAADSEAALAMLPEQLESYRRLVVETGALFGARHYEHYDFLYALSDHVAHFGLEHHQSSDNRLDERTLIEEDLRRESADLLPHEMVHSWNGKHRRPANLATPDYLTPMRSELLWVYEGLTQYWGKVLTARVGLWTPEEFRADLALLAANLDHEPGREWRPLQDTADEAQLLYYGRNDWASLRRGVDFYDEGVLIWLEADVTIRTLSGGKKSLDDFARRFHGGQSSGPVVRPYSYADVVQALNEVAAYDWNKFLSDRLTSTAPRAPLGGIEAGGWKVGYADKPSAMQKSSESNRKRINLRDSIGIWVQEDGTIADVVPGMAAAKAGVGPGMKLIAINERKYSDDVVREAIKAGKGSRAPLALLLESNGYFKTYAVDYHDGERYPVLERDPAKPDLLGEIIKPLGNAPTPGTGDLSHYLRSALPEEHHYLADMHHGEGCSGPELMHLMRKQATNFGARIETDDIVELDVSRRPFALRARSGQSVHAHAVIIATGARANYLGLDSEEQFKNRGVSACAVCDGALPRFRNKPLVVVGGGDSAVEEADFLSKFGSTVYMIHRRDELRASKIMAQRALNNPKISLQWNSQVANVVGNDKDGVTGVELQSTVDDSRRTLDAAGMFVAIGHTPNTRFLEGKLELNAKKYIKWTVPQRTNTSVEGVFAAGDVADDYYRQAVTAAGTGCMAALDAERWLAAQGL